MSILGNLSIETITPMLKKYMDKEKIESIIISKTETDFEIKNYSINVLKSIAVIKTEIDENRNKIDLLNVSLKQKNELIESIINIVNSRKSDVNKMKELNKLLS